MRTIKTGNELFDIFWAAYPPRINGAGAMEKKRKGPALKWFETHKPTEEQVYDMVRWVNADKANRANSGDHFYSAPPDAIVWLNQKRWMDEIGVEVTKTVRREAHRSKAVYSNNVKELIAHWQGVILEWSDGKLRESKAFQAAWKYPEFRKWVKEQRAKPDKADYPPLSEPKNAVATPNVALLQPDTTADLPPPPQKIDKFNARLEAVRAYHKKNPTFI